MNNYKTIFPESIMQRMKVNRNIIFVDLHNLRVYEVKRLLNNSIALNRDGANLAMIHGYNRGTALKKYIYEYEHERILDKKIPRNNPGITYITVEPAYSAKVA